MACLKLDTTEKSDAVTSYSEYMLRRSKGTQQKNQIQETAKDADVDHRAAENAFSGTTKTNAKGQSSSAKRR